MKIKVLLTLFLAGSIFFACNRDDAALAPASSQPAQPEVSASSTPNPLVAQLAVDPNMIAYYMAIQPIHDDESVLQDPAFVYTISTARGIVVANFSPFNSMTPEDIQETLHSSLNHHDEIGTGLPGGGSGGNTTLSSFRRCQRDARNFAANEVSNGANEAVMEIFLGRALCACCDEHNKTQSDRGCDGCSKLPEG
ncbi:MAG: hypothetical protein ACFB10_06295 [Salibacteraceae bacterium]